MSSGTGDRMADWGGDPLNEPQGGAASGGEVTGGSFGEPRPVDQDPIPAPPPGPEAPPSPPLPEGGNGDKPSFPPPANVYLEAIRETIVEQREKRKTKRGVSSGPTAASTHMAYKAALEELHARILMSGSNATEFVKYVKALGELLESVGKFNVSTANVASLRYSTMAAKKAEKDIEPVWDD